MCSARLFYYPNRLFLVVLFFKFSSIFGVGKGTPDSAYILVIRYKRRRGVATLLVA